MLQFIVLGYIPGTTIQFNFLEFVLSAALIAALVVGIWRHETKRARRLAAQTALSLIAI